MSFVLKPWQLWIVAMAGWINQQQQEVIEYLRAENQVLKELHGKRRLLLNDDQRRRLAVKGKVLGRKLLKQIATIVTPDTLLLLASAVGRREVGRQPATAEEARAAADFGGHHPTGRADGAGEPELGL